MSTETDLAAAITYSENIYRQSGPAATQIGAVVTALEETPPDVTTALAQAKAAVTNVAYLAFQSADLNGSLAALNTDINPPAPPPTPPPVTTGITVATATTTGGPPGVRGEPGGAYHPGTGLLYFACGNSNAGQLGDTWSFNPVNGAWTKLAATVPGNTAISIGYDPVTKKLIMFGGDNDSTTSNATYALDPTVASPTWTKLSPATSPPVRSGHCCFNDPVTGDVMVYGGNQLGVAAALDDLWKWTGTTWVEVSSALTGTPRTGAFAVTIGTTTVIFGGNGTGLFNDTHVWNGTTCVKASPTTSPPARRFGGGAATNDGRALIYGGCNADFSVNSSDCWTWDGTNWTKQSPTVGGLSSQIMVLHPPTGKLIMAFGTAGASASSMSSDINTVYEFTVGGSVTPPPSTTGLSITTASLPGGTVGTAYSAQLAASGGTGTLSWGAATLPAGLSLSTAGVLSGTPTAAGTDSITITLKDSNNDTPATKTFTVVIAPASVTPPPTTGAPILGLYVGGAGAAPVQALAAKLGVTCQAFGAYDTRDTWADIAGSTWIEDGADGMRLVAGIGLCPTGVSLTAVPANVSVFATVAAALAAGTIVRLGWEFDGGWYAWGINYPGNTPASYAAAWQAVVPVMKAANPGLLFDFCSNAGSSQTMAQLEAFYPGDEYVDYIGCDYYYENGNTAGGSPTVMTPVVELAAARGKPFSSGEWGLNGTDQPGFITNMAEVFLSPSTAAPKYGWPAYTCAYQSYFSADLASGGSGINSDITQFPNSIAAYKAAFAGE